MGTMATGEQITSETMGPGDLERRAEQPNGFNGVPEDYSAEVRLARRVVAHGTRSEVAQRDDHSRCPWHSIAPASCATTSR